MDISKDERLANDMTNTGVICPSSECKDRNHQMEQVTGFLRYTCHWCGGVIEYDDKGNITESWFEGFK